MGKKNGLQEYKLQSVGNKFGYPSINSLITSALRSIFIPEVIDKLLICSPSGTIFFLDS